MVAGLLFITGLIAVVITIVVVGYSAPVLIQTFISGMEAPGANMFRLIGQTAGNLAWALGPFVGGLCLMGFARMLQLLAAIHRAVRDDG
jgi:hypothetical protein